MKAVTYLKRPLFFIVFILFACQQEDDVFTSDPKELQKSLYKQRLVSLGDIPEIKNFIISNTYPEVFSVENEDSNPIIFDTANILEIIDTLNNANYSLQFRYADSPLGDFYNLVVGQTPLGETITPFVIKLKSEAAHINQFIAHDFDVSYFKGSMEVHKYTDYFQVGSLATSIGRGTDYCPPDFDEVGDPIPCKKRAIYPSGSGGASSGDGSGTSGGPLDSDFGEGDSENDMAWLCYHRGQLHASPNDCNDPGAGGVWIIDMSASSQRTTRINNGYGIQNDNCPKCDIAPITPVGINPVSIRTMRGTLKRKLNLSRAGLNWLGDSANNVEVALIYNYIAPYLELGIAINPQVKNYLNTLINALESNDFSEFFALDLFTQNPYSIWKEISQAERDLIKKFPLEAYGIFKNREIATTATIQKFGINGRNDKSDAFRHAYYNVINAKYVGVYFAKLFSDAHESENPVILALEEQMDLFNNDVGHQSINGNGSLSNSQLADLIYQKLLNGDLRYLSPLDTVIAPFYGISNLTQLIPTNQ